MLSTLQAEHRNWAALMFPHQEPVLPAAALVEECGELVRALLKSELAQKYGEEPRYKDRDWKAALVDAIGDVAISTCSLCNASGLDFYQLSSSSLVPVSTTPMECAARLLSYASSILTSCALGDPVEPLEVSSVMCYLRRLSFLVRVDFVDAVEVTWKQVKERKR
jgi:NTP pyrophosphatase (non-canonical NTP hydrolase)